MTTGPLAYISRHGVAYFSHPRTVLFHLKSSQLSGASNIQYRRLATQKMAVLVGRSNLNQQTSRTSLEALSLELLQGELYPGTTRHPATTMETMAEKIESQVNQSALPANVKTALIPSSNLRLKFMTGRFLAEFQNNSWIPSLT